MVQWSGHHRGGGDSGGDGVVVRVTCWWLHSLMGVLAVCVHGGDIPSYRLVGLVVKASSWRRHTWVRFPLVAWVSFYGVDLFL